MKHDKENGAYCRTIHLKNAECYWKRNNIMLSAHQISSKENLVSHCVCFKHTRKQNGDNRSKEKNMKWRCRGAIVASFFFHFLILFYCYGYDLQTIVCSFTTASTFHSVVYELYGVHWKYATAFCGFLSVFRIIFISLESYGIFQREKQLFSLQWNHSAWCVLDFNA